MARAKQSKQRKTATPPPPYQYASVFDDPPRQNVLLLSCMDQRLLDETVEFMNALNLDNRYDQIALAGGAMGAHRLLVLKDPPQLSADWWTVFASHLFAAINVLHRPIKDVFLMDHLDCGAYKYLHPDKAVALEYRDATAARREQLHLDELRALSERVRTFCDEQRQKAEVKRTQAIESCAEKPEDAKDDKDPKESECLKSTRKLHDELVDAWTDIRISCFLMDLRGRVTQLDLPKGETDTLEQ